MVFLDITVPQKFLELCGCLPRFQQKWVANRVAEGVAVGALG